MVGNPCLSICVVNMTFNCHPPSSISFLHWISPLAGTLLCISIYNNSEHLFLQSSELTPRVLLMLWVGDWGRKIVLNSIGVSAFKPKGILRIFLLARTSVRILEDCRSVRSDAVECFWKSSCFNTPSSKESLSFYLYFIKGVLPRRLAVCFLALISHLQYSGSQCPLQFAAASFFSFSLFLLSISSIKAFSSRLFSPGRLLLSTYYPHWLNGTKHVGINNYENVWQSEKYHRWKIISSLALDVLLVINIKKCFLFTFNSILQSIWGHFLGFWFFFFKIFLVRLWKLHYYEHQKAGIRRCSALDSSNCYWMLPVGFHWKCNY